MTSGHLARYGGAEKHCLRKTAFWSEAEAMNVARRAMKKRGGELKAYRCRNCPCWHLTGWKTLAKKSKGTPGMKIPQWQVDSVREWARIRGK